MTCFIVTLFAVCNLLLEGELQARTLFGSLLYQLPLSLSLLGLLEQNIILIECLKQQTFISHSSGGWEVGDQSASRSGVWGEPSSWLVDDCPLTAYSCGIERALVSSFPYKGPNPSLRAPLMISSKPKYLPKTVSKIHIAGIRTSVSESGGTHTFSTQYPPAVS